MRGKASPTTREEVSFHKEMVRELKREISMIDRNSNRKYIREFDEEFRSYDEISSFDDLVISAYKADIIYVGDYHALPQSQIFASRLLQEVASRSRHVRLGMEMVFGRNQQILNRWMNGSVTEGEFLRRIRYHLDWGYDWGSFRRIFDVARERGIPVLALDCEPRNGFRYIRRRDQYAAERIVEELEMHPEAKLVVMFGESHLASSHLPAKVRDGLKAKNLEKRDLVVVQNVEKIYWQLAEEGHQHVDVVRCGPSRFCIFNVSPLAKYESYRQTIERWKVEGEEDEELDLGPTIYNMIDTILKFLRVDKYRQKVGPRGSFPRYLVDAFPEVYSDMEMAPFRRILREGRLRPEEIAEVEHHVDRNGSCYVPRLNLIFIGKFNLVHGGEEAAHFVHNALRREILDGAPSTMPRADLFYVTVMEEALGFFGSKLIDPSRNHFFETKLYRYYRKEREVVERETPYTLEEYNEIMGFILLHKKFERSYADYDDVPAELLQGIQNDRRFSELTHQLGYFLGQQIYDAYRLGSIRREEITALFRRRFRPGGDALECYLDLVEQVRDPNSL